MARILLLLLLLSLSKLSAQDFEIVRHNVQMGETVRMLSKKYKVEPSEIYRLNKFAIEGIRQGMVLQIMVPKKEPAAEPEVAEAGEPSNNEAEVTSTNGVIAEETVESRQELEINHTVAKGETLYSLARKYNVPVDEIKARNEQILKKGLQTGQVLTIRTTNP